MDLLIVLLCCSASMPQLAVGEDLLLQPTSTRSIQACNQAPVTRCPRRRDSTSFMSVVILFIQGIVSTRGSQIP